MLQKEDMGVEFLFPLAETFFTIDNWKVNRKEYLCFYLDV